MGGWHPACNLSRASSLWRPALSDTESLRPLGLSVSPGRPAVAQAATRGRQAPSRCGQHLPVGRSMSLGQTLELTALIAAQGTRLVQHVPRLSESSLRAYWTHAKCRLVQWGTELRKFDRARELLGTTWAQNQWHAQRHLAVAILVADLPTRAWTAVSLAHDRAQRRNDAGPLSENILVGQTECRHRALHQRDCCERVRSFVETDLFQLQRRCERFCDLIIGKLAAELPNAQDDIFRLAYDASRADDFAQTMCQRRNGQRGEQAWNLTLLSLRELLNHLATDPTPPCPHTPLVISAIMNCFPHQSCESLSLLPTLWQTRLENTADDARLLLEEWLLIGD